MRLGRRLGFQRTRFDGFPDFPDLISNDMTDTARAWFAAATQALATTMRHWADNDSEEARQERAEKLTAILSRARELGPDNPLLELAHLCAELSFEWCVKLGKRSVF